MILNVGSNVQEQENKPKTRKESWWGVRYYQFKLCNIFLTETSAANISPWLFYPSFST